MNRTVIFLLGLIAFVFLCIFCIQKHTPVIQEDILSRVSTALSHSPTSWAKVNVNGRNIQLTGVAPTDVLRIKAGDIAQAVPGVVSVNNQITIVEAIATPKIQPSLDSFVINPYKSIFTKQGANIVLSGFAPNEQNREIISQHAEKRFGIDHINNQLKIAPGEPEGWLDAAKLAINNLTMFNDGNITLADNKIKLSGHIVKQASKNIIEKELQKRLPENYKIDFDLIFPQMDVEETIKEKHLNCSDKFYKDIASQTIHFSSDSSGLEKNAEDVLNKILQFSTLCPNSIIQVAGYTDTQGNSAYNMYLSKNRAEAVVNTLIKKGMPANRLKAIGFGETKSLTKDTSRSGHAKNRRIEFKYLQEGE